MRYGTAKSCRDLEARERERESNCRLDLKTSSSMSARTYWFKINPPSSSSQSSGGYKCFVKHSFMTWCTKGADLQFPCTLTASLSRHYILVYVTSQVTPQVVFWLLRYYFCYGSQAQLLYNFSVTRFTDVTKLIF